VGISTN